VFTFTNCNTGKKDGMATLYLDGKVAGTVTGREQTLSWDPAKAVAMLGLNYTGLFDELAFFNRALSAAEVEELFRLPEGIATLRSGLARTRRGQLGRRRAILPFDGSGSGCPRPGVLVQLGETPSDHL
jgi:hypothetical protein